MPVLINLDFHDHHLFSRNNSAKMQPVNQVETVGCINIGLINNMPDSALVSTERQLFDLLSTACGRFTVRLHLYAIEKTPRSDWGRDYVRRFYLGMNDLMSSRLDGLIITGAEPKATNLRDEPYWVSFGEAVDWAKENTLSTVCSCLAVHGAVLHLDGIERRQLPDKCLGVFTQTRIVDHPLMLDIPSTLRIPHSRWNEVREGALVDSGYIILTESDEAGADCFIKRHGKSLFVYFQGHPEYEAQSLLGEYRRDVGRFLRGESDTYPAMPKYYFNDDAEETLHAFQRSALLDRRPELLSDFPVDRLAKDLKNTWQSAARRIYRNWILHLSSQKKVGERSHWPSAMSKFPNQS
jgi:homoserine O-succinyltransferase/O-acetyltransferase